MPCIASNPCNIRTYYIYWCFIVIVIDYIARHYRRNRPRPTDNVIRLCETCHVVRGRSVARCNPL